MDETIVSVVEEYLISRGLKATRLEDHNGRAILNFYLIPGVPHNWKKQHFPYLSIHFTHKGMFISTSSAEIPVEYSLAAPDSLEKLAELIMYERNCRQTLNTRV